MNKSITLFVRIIVLVLVVVSCSGEPGLVLRVLDEDTMQVITITGDKTRPVSVFEADFVILGGGLGGIAAALSICSSGRTVILIEESDRIAGCFAHGDTSTYTENRFVDTSGSSQTYQMFRKRIVEWYAKRSEEQPLQFSDIFDRIDDFGGDEFCFGTDAALDVIDDMLALNVERGKLTILKRQKAAHAIMYYDRIHSLRVIDLDEKICNQVAGWMYIDATRTGYLFPLAGIGYAVGKESGTDTGEPHAPAQADTMFSQKFVYCPKTKLPDDKVGVCVVTDTVNEPSGEGDDALRFSIVSEPRRMTAFGLLDETDFSADFNDGCRAAFFKDSVGIGYYPMVIDDGNPLTPPEIVPTKPFQIPLRALVHKGVKNLLAGGGTIGSTYIASTALRAPATEWAIGEAAGEVAAHCAGMKVYTHEFINSPDLVRQLQQFLVGKRGIPIYWYDDVAPGDDDFVEAQLRPFDEPDFDEKQDSLHDH